MGKLSQGERIELFTKLDLYLENCKGCEKENPMLGHISPDDRCGDCSNYYPIREIGMRLGADRIRRKVRVESYIEMKRKGWTDKKAIEWFGVSKATLARRKRQWRKDGYEFK